MTNPMGVEQDKLATSREAPDRHLACTPLAIDIETDRNGNIERVGCAGGDEAYSSVWSEFYYYGGSHTLIFHNALFDVPILVRHGVVMDGPIFDTMWAFHMLHPDLKKDLTTAATCYLDVRRWKHTKDRTPAFYNEMDARVTLALYHRLRDELAVTGQLPLFESMMSGLRVLIDSKIRYGVEYVVPWGDDHGSIQSGSVPQGAALVWRYRHDPKTLAILSGDDQLLRDLDRGDDLYTELGQAWSCSRSCAQGLHDWGLAGASPRGLPAWIGTKSTLGGGHRTAANKERSRLRLEFDQRYARLRAWQEEQEERAQVHGFATNPYGRRRRWYKPSRPAIFRWLIASTECDLMWAWLAELAKKTEVLGVTSTEVHFKNVIELPCMKGPT